MSDTVFVLPQGGALSLLPREGMRVGHGASLTGGVELGSFTTRPKAETTLPLHRELQAWLRDVFAELTPFPAEQVMYAPACARFFHPYMLAWHHLASIGETIDLARVRLVGDFPIWQRVLAKLRGEPLAPSPPPRFVAASIAAAAAWMARERGRKHRLVTATGASGDPAIWLGLIADWPRFSEHVARALLDEDAGLLAIVSLSEGVREEASLTARGQGFFSGIAGADAAPLEQAVLPRSLATFAVTQAKAARAAFVAARRAAAKPLLGSGDAGAARLFSIDLFRAFHAYAATEELGRRRSLKGRTAVLVTAANPAGGATCAALDRLGARTIEVFHGCNGDDWYGASLGFPQRRATWTEPDKESIAAYGLDTFVGGMPLRVKRRGYDRNGTRALLMTSYCHRDSASGGVYPYAPGLDALLSALVAFEAKAKVRLQWTFRPHPADDRVVIAQVMQRFASLDLTLSTARDVGDDIDRADLIVSTLSTVVADALLSGQPTFVHMFPEFMKVPGGAFVDPARRFFATEEGAELLAQFWQSRSLEPEARALRKLFGPSGVPRQLREALVVGAQ